MKNKVFAALVALTLVALVPYVAGAIDTDYVVVDPSPYVDSHAHVWGTKVVWRRAINIDNDPYIDVLLEPSWIMMYDTASKESINITPANVLNVWGDYESAEAPAIWGNKIIYEYQYGDDGWEDQLRMYNISSGETWTVPIPITHTSGHSHNIHGEWILASHYGTGNRQLYLYNYITTEFKTMISTADPYTALDPCISNNHAIYTRYNPSTLVFQVCIFNLTSYKLAILDATDIGSNNLRSFDVYDYTLSLGVQKVTPVTTWDSYVYDLTAIPWDTFGISQVFYWGSHISGNVTTVDDNSTYDSYPGYIWGDWVAFNVDGTYNDVIAYNMASNRTVNVTVNSYTQTVSGIYMDKIVWVDNRNGDTNYGNYSDNWDVYRTQTASENVSELIWAILPLILVGMAVTAVAVAIKGIGGRGL